MPYKEHMSGTSTIQTDTQIARPFLRWTGSKKWLVKEQFQQYLPKNFNDYHESFLGGGAVFFSLQNKRHSFLNDSNPELVETYIQIRDNLDDVISNLKKLKNTEEDYYTIRKRNCRTPITRAARFIYLNRCSFNGIYRVNIHGKYNVPYGQRKNVDIVTEENLRRVNLALQNTTITAQDFKQTLENIKEGDLVFLDPPYTIAHENNGFIAYNQKLFSWEDQVALKDFCHSLNDRGAYFILTNAYHLSLLDLYKDFEFKKKISRRSIVGGRVKTRGQYNELLICNTL